MSPRERLVRQLAVKYGLDPDAVVAISSVEGSAALHGGNSIGDHGTSFGPFQLHAGGALPKGKGNAWANSRAGIDYAERQMAQYARGLKGKAAVSAISSRFERPADVPGEIAKAMGYYGKGGSTPVGALPAAPGANGGDSGAVQGLSAQALKAMYASALLQPGGMDTNSLLQLAVARKQMGAAQQQYGSGAKGPVVPATAPGAGKGGAGINELFYDPLGGIKYGKEIGAIGHHGDHVHMSLANGRAQLAAIAQAKRMGMHVGEDGLAGGTVHQVHVGDSFHYRKYGKQFGNLREAADVSGTPQQMAAFYRWVQHSYG